MVLLFFVKKVSGENFCEYTKTFGGKIWNKLHRVSPENFFRKNFYKVPPIIPAKNHLNGISCKKKNRETPIYLKKIEKIGIKEESCLGTTVYLSVEVFALQIFFCTRCLHVAGLKGKH